MTPFFLCAHGDDPRSLFPSLEARTDVRGPMPVDFDAILADARRRFVCAECGTELTRWQRTSVQFCSPKCRYRFRDRRRYAEDPEGARVRARAYYAANRERVLEKAATRRGRERPAELRHCSECGDPLEGRQRVTCGKARCRDRRFRRLHPHAYAERERQKVEQRRTRRAESSLTDAELSQKRSGIRDLPSLDDQATVAVRENDLVDLEGLPGSRDSGEFSVESAGHHDSSHCP